MLNRSVLLLIALAGCSALGGCIRQAAPADGGAVADQVRKDAAGVVAAYNAKDAHRAAAYDSPDYVGVYHGSANTIGPAADEAAMKTQMAAAKVDWQLGPGKVTVSKGGDLGVFEAPYLFIIGTPQSGETRESGTWIAIFKRQSDGSMKLWRSIASDGPPVRPETP